jgi:hypothetical protein
MALSQAAYRIEKGLRHEDATVRQDISTFQSPNESSDTMKALVWQGKQQVAIGPSTL